MNVSLNALIDGLLGHKAVLEAAMDELGVDASSHPEAVAAWKALQVDVGKLVSLAAGADVATTDPVEEVETEPEPEPAEPGESIFAHINIPAGQPKPPEPPAYQRRYTHEDCHYICDGTGLLVAQAFDKVRGQGVDHPVIGIVGDAGTLAVGDGSYHDPATIKNGGEPIRLTVVGLDNEAEVTMAGLGNKYAEVESLRMIGGQFGKPIGIRGGNDSFIIRQTGRVGQLIFDNFQWMPHILEDGSPKLHTSSISLAHGWDQLVIRGRYDENEFAEHSLAYLKGGRATWILWAELDGGNRTGFQVRPHLAYSDHTSAPQPWTEPHDGPLVILGNSSHSFGWSHLNPSGGSVITVWNNLGPTWILDNAVEEARYGCVAIADQSEIKNHLRPDGFPIGPVYFGGNRCTNTNGDRHAVAIAGCSEFHWWPDNEATFFQINTDWSHEEGAGIDVGVVYDHTENFDGAADWAMLGDDTVIESV